MLLLPQITQLFRTFFAKILLLKLVEFIHNKTFD